MNCRFIVHIILKKRNLSSGLFKNAVNSLINWYTEVASEEKTRIEPREPLSYNTYQGGMMEKNNEVIQTHPLVGWDISTVDSYDALMLRLHYQTPESSGTGRD